MPATNAANASVAAFSAQSEALLGPSEAMARLWSQIRRVAPHFRAALLVCEPSCGAETVARALHALSPLQCEPFTVLDATAAEERLLRAASVVPRGLLFFSAIEQLSRPAQRTLLRWMRTHGPALRVVAEARCSLRAAVSAGQFNAQLADALGAVSLTLPALRERTDDLPVLATHTLERLAIASDVPAPALSQEFLRVLRQCEWLGNLEELEAVLTHMLHTQASWDAASLDAALAMRTAAAPVAATHAHLERLDKVVNEHVRRVLLGCDGNKLRAADVLGISRSTLYRMLDAQTAADRYPLAG